MGIDEKYGRVVTERGSIPDDEPVFVLRAKDRLAIETLVAYRQAVVATQGDTAHAVVVETVIANFQEWRRANPDLVKDPD